MKLIFVTGGVMSSLGKGILASSLSKCLSCRGIAVRQMKIDPYLNCDAGTLNPLEHGECYVTKDGKECDLDVGNYERFTDHTSISDQNIMIGDCYRAVIEDERRGKFGGATVQMIPHMTNEIKRRIRSFYVSSESEVLIVECGGTVGDLEAEIVLESIRQLKFEPNNDVLFIHVAPVMKIMTGEEKTKPMQHSVKVLLSRGVVPNIVVARTKGHLSESTFRKISMFCNVPVDHIFDSPDVKTVYALPLELHKQRMDDLVISHLSLHESKVPESRSFATWEGLVNKLSRGSKRVRVALVGKYVSDLNNDTYLSVLESLKHAAIHADIIVDDDFIHMMDADSMVKDGIETTLSSRGISAICVPGGFGIRGFESMIKVIAYARKNRIPFLGICLGMQLAVIEIARNLAGLKDANTSEVDKETPNDVVCLLPEKENITDIGGTLRLGSYPVLLVPQALESSQITALYAGSDVLPSSPPTSPRSGNVSGNVSGSTYPSGISSVIYKRFRHRYEVNPKFVPALTDGTGVVFSGVDASRNTRTVVKILEVVSPNGGGFHVGVQYHPEFDSRLERPEPMFMGLLRAALSLVGKGSG